MGTTLVQWQQFIGGRAPEGTLPSHILESWQRCRAAGVEHTPKQPLPSRLPDGELQPRLRTNAKLVAAGRTQLGLASACLAAGHHALILTDRDGVVLEAAGNEPKMDELAATAGGDWSERRRGTNGAGTALAAGRALTVIGPEHFRSGLHDWACAGAPIHDARGRVVGAVNLITPAADGGPHRLELVCYLARVVGRDLDERPTIRMDPFLDQLAHELRNPLEPLLNSLHILRLSGQDTDTATEARELAERQVHMLSRLVDDLLNVSRIARGKLQLRKERVSLARVIHDALAATQHLLDARQHQVAVLLPPDPIHLDGDPVQLARAVSALLLNANRNTESGGHVWVTVERDGGEVLISVRDTGTGLPADMLSRIFDLYSQKDPGTPARLGIGLNLARSLVEMHGGSIVALSDGPGEGSEFVIRLPAPDARANVNGVERRQDGTHPSLRVLVVDDDIDGARSLAQLLHIWHHEVQVAHEGLTALEMARAWRPEVVLLDLGLPGGLDGYEVARRLRGEFGLDHTLLIALTGWGQEEDRQNSRKAGFDHHLVKPADPQALRELLARRSQGSESGDEDES